MVELTRSGAGARLQNWNNNSLLSEGNEAIMLNESGMLYFNLGHYGTGFNGVHSENVGKKNSSRRGTVVDLLKEIRAARDVLWVWIGSGSLKRFASGGS